MQSIQISITINSLQEHFKIQIRLTCSPGEYIFLREHDTEILYNICITFNAVKFDSLSQITVFDNAHEALLILLFDSATRHASV